MWAVGDLFFLVGMLLAVWVWMRAEEVEGRRADAKLDRDEAAAAAAAARASATQPAAPPTLPTDR